VAELLEIRATFLADRGRHAEAAATAAKFRDHAPTNPDNLYTVACCYALCIPGIAPGKKPEQLSADEQETRARYTTLALEAISQAIDRGFNNLHQLERDIDLVTIRQEPRFRTLVDRLRKPR
jgi:hypothetical protein